MKIACIWEHNGDDTLLYARDFPGAYCRGKNLEEASSKLTGEIQSYLCWAGQPVPTDMEPEIIQDVSSQLEIRDADSDVLLEGEDKPLSMAEYQNLKALALKSAEDFLALYQSFPDKQKRVAPIRRTFYGQVPGTAEEMYQHTKNVNAYYFGEIGVDADNDGNILDCRRRGFAALEVLPGFLEMGVIKGSYEELWSVRKVLRRFLWHDRIHAKAMFRHGRTAFGSCISDIFGFDT